MKYMIWVQGCLSIASLFGGCGYAESQCTSTVVGDLHVEQFHNKMYDCPCCLT
jgi:hypothetical protein